MELKSIKIEKPADVNMILGMAHFIKTVEDLHEALVNSVPSIKFGIAFSEATKPCLVRLEGNDERLKDLAAKNIMNISAGHSFLIFIKDAFPINVLNAIKRVPEVVNIFCATANEVEVIVAETNQGRAILGVVDGYMPKGIESEEDKRTRKSFLRQIGYKL